MPMETTDRELLAMLRERDAGATFSEIAKRLGVSRNVVAGSLNRIKTHDVRAHGFDGPAPGDGEMGAHWIDAGLQAQERRA